MKFKLLFLPVALGLVACQPLKGPLQVNEHFKVINKDKKVVPVLKGSYDAEFKYDEGKREAEIKIKGMNNGKDQKIQFKIPANVNIPTTQGSFNMRGEDMNQEFNLSGRIATDVNDSAPRFNREGCSYSVPDRVCESRRVCPPVVRGRPNRPCRTETVCRNVLRTVYGYRDVEYFVRTTHQSLEASFTSARQQLQTQPRPQQPQRLARLSADRTSSENINIRVGRCL